jgi:hypothetical protein
MSKRKPAKSSKRARSPAIATRAHGKKRGSGAFARAGAIAPVWTSARSYQKKAIKIETAYEVTELLRSSD